jgi:hypothetical protein
MTREQKIVAIGSASGVVTMIAAVVGIYHIWPINASLTDATSRLAYTMQANAFAVIPLLLGILVIGNARFLSEAIDPTLEKEDLQCRSMAASSTIPCSSSLCSLSRLRHSV